MNGLNPQIDKWDTRYKGNAHALLKPPLEPVVEATKTLKPGRNFSGNFAFHRHYYFEFSLNGHDRFNGSAFLIGQKLESIQLNHPDGIIIQETQN